MEETRSQLADKLEALESQVADTVQNTTEAVTETVENVKETVEKASETVENVTDTVKETVDTLGEAFNLWTQTERHPWLVFGGSVLLGYLGAQLFGGSAEEAEEEEEPREKPTPAWSPAREAEPRRETGWQPAQTPTPSPPHQEQPAHEEKSWFWDQLGRLKGLAIGSLMGVVRDLTKHYVPEPIGKRVAEEVDTLTTHLGGEPVQGQMLPNNPTSTPQPPDNSPSPNRPAAPREGADHKAAPHREKVRR